MLAAGTQGVDLELNDNVDSFLQWIADNVDYQWRIQDLKKGGCPGFWGFALKIFLVNFSQFRGLFKIRGGAPPAPDYDTETHPGSNTVHMSGIMGTVTPGVCTYHTLKRRHRNDNEIHKIRKISYQTDPTSGPVFSYKLRYIVGFWLVEMAISTNQKPTIYRNLYENTGPVYQQFQLRQVLKIWGRGPCRINTLYSTSRHFRKPS